MRWLLGRPWLDAADDFAACARQLTAKAWPEEFAFAEFFDDQRIVDLCLAGFMPMSAELPVALSRGEGPATFDSGSWRRRQIFLTPKLHLFRCLLVPEACHASRSARRQASSYRLTLNQAFDMTLDRCVAAHGGDWLTPPLVAAFKRLHAASAAGLPGSLRFVSVELWRDEAGADDPSLATGQSVAAGQLLVAGEIGYQAGAIYTSLSGFRGPSGSGTVQLAALAAALRQHGVSLWDLGMPMDYKSALGAGSVNRATFLACLRRLSTQPAISLGSQWPATGQSAADLIKAPVADLITSLETVSQA
ncbi:MAG: hypothetical protein A2087_04855 [Spirochaetes bacterium GWD1_61_31]|nr:MAG: hypothetical protein A2Y37_01605 [Spirochaetes bacterium GWB1_60_80]OHD34910.1 MAG: hypothetical protein A2004_00635 [Spirochaetes bacterium GWC1_61_12]OHD37061.1 MAG: hypothetical protein A2087_04855 [Spirochaetes bacterium GWD1_61_31]OHD45329.1 MAG: hypothetical protein A2Y35_00535 [Spirochaetes bacterium GWE1_60_18]OHD61081.1 MAG: hypothetical protein A2Y32_09220 [Spirochaetes bacterium GWF1_60_12]HAP42742.1 hypothetical protein [Spirochaetaceae bacterium]